MAVPKCRMSSGATSMDLVVSSDQINLGKSYATLDIGGKVLKMWDQVVDKDGSIVHGTVIPTWLPNTGGFPWDHVKSSPGGSNLKVVKPRQNNTGNNIV